MSNEEIRQLAQWLSEAGLGGVELQRPGVKLVLKRHLESIVAHESIELATPANQVPICTRGLVHVVVFCDQHLWLIGVAEQQLAKATGEVGS